jgi:hypothetical protein
MAAAYLGCASTAELYRQVMDGKLPRPNDRRGRHPIWYRVQADAWLARRAQDAQGIDAARDSIRDLV